MATLWRPEPEMWDTLREAVPGILADQREDGRFGTDALDLSGPASDLPPVRRLEPREQSLVS